MNARITAFVASRLFAIHVLISYVLNYALLLIGSFIDHDILTHAGSLIFGAAFSAILALVLWFGAGWVANRIVTHLPNGDGDGLNIDQWKALVVAAIGALFILVGVNILSRAFDEGSILNYAVVSGGFYTITGFTLIAWSGFIVGGLKALLSWFARPAFDRDDQ